jgi:hypothetical protein
MINQNNQLTNLDNGLNDSFAFSLISPLSLTTLLALNS